MSSRQTDSSIENVRAGDVVEAPTELDGVNAHWLTAALQVRYPGVVVTHSELSQVRHGSNTTARVNLEYADPSELPPTMWLKGGWGGRARYGLVPEVRFYQEVAPRLSINRADIYFAGVSRERSDEAAMLMEDLTRRGARIGEATDTASPDQVAELLDMLADLHALEWNSSYLRTSDWLTPRFRTDDPDSNQGIFGSFVPVWWDKQMSRPRSAAVPDELRDRNTVRRALVNLFATESAPDSPDCLVHGDMHLGNTFFEANGRPGIMDLPCGVGHWAHDVTYGIISWLDPAVRAANDRALFQHYLGRLAAHGGPTLEPNAAWLQWRQHIIHGFMWVMCSPRQQPEDLITAQTTRFALAATDHDMLGALEVR